MHPESFAMWIFMMLESCIFQSYLEWAANEETIRIFTFIYIKKLLAAHIAGLDLMLGFHA